MRALPVFLALSVGFAAGVAVLPADDASRFDRTGGPLYSGVGGVTAPELDPASKVAPIYPKKAKHDGVVAKCILQPVIRKDGSVGPLEVLECQLVFADGSSRFDAWPRQNDVFCFAQSCFDAVRQWRYKPATKDNEPVDAYFTVLVTFELAKKGSGA